MAGESKFVYELTAAPTPLSGNELLHVNVPDGAGGWNSRQTSLHEILLDLVPASGISQAFADGRYLLKANNLSGLTDVAAARGNLSVYSKAEVDAALSAIPAGIEANRTKPSDAAFTALNHFAGTVHGDTAKGCQMTVIGGGSILQCMVANAVPNAANFTATFRVHRLRPTDPSGDQAMIFIRNSTNGRVTMFADFASNQWLIQAWTSVNAFSGNELGAVAGEPASFPWRRIRRVGTDLFFEASQDGENWGSVFIGDATSGWAVASFMTAGGGNIDQVGFGVQSNGATARIPLGTICTHFTLTTP